MSRYYNAIRLATGEMTYVDPEEWPVHKKIADALGGELMPFDKYQGPFIALGGKKIFIGPPEEMWQAMILGKGWVGGIDSKEQAERQAGDAMAQQGIEHDVSDLVRPDNTEGYLIATDTVSGISTPAYRDSPLVADELVDAITRNLLHPQNLPELEEQWTQPPVEPDRSE